MTMIRVGTAEVYVYPDGNVTSAFMGVVWGVNAKCKERGEEPIFGLPKLPSDDTYSYEEYPEARVIHVRDIGRAKELDPTIRIVPTSDHAKEVFAEVWAEVKDRIALQRYAHTIPGVDPQKLANMAYLDPR